MICQAVRAPKQANPCSNRHRCRARAGELPNYDFALDNLQTEGVGFEPTVGVKPTLDFESSALNRTQPPFQTADCWRSAAHYSTPECVCKRPV